MVQYNDPSGTTGGGGSSSSSFLGKNRILQDLLVLPLYQVVLVPGCIIPVKLTRHKDQAIIAWLGRKINECRHTPHLRSHVNIGFLPQSTTQEDEEDGRQHVETKADPSVSEEPCEPRAPICSKERDEFGMRLRRTTECSDGNDPMHRIAKVLEHGGLRDGVEPLQLTRREEEVPTQPHEAAPAADLPLSCQPAQVDGAATGTAAAAAITFVTIAAAAAW